MGTLIDAPGPPSEMLLTLCLLQFRLRLGNKRVHFLNLNPISPCFRDLLKSALLEACHCLSANATALTQSCAQSSPCRRQTSSTLLKGDLTIKLSSEVAVITAVPRLRGGGCLPPAIESGHWRTHHQSG